ncbi:DsrE family protein [Crocosphaera sp. UHCC 0190]|uniref:DsrE family protein n=1 Tax=Crocosphaera sp. UHCC 0190 TaxID=3110246 RepID=UPI002B20FC7F|nr:DsrE family protein [Crocosphaera sp. UHCC 0190]MEA5512085.1 DsrE family protein [Crocosphaera sp. UHCC 0190]
MAKYFLIESQSPFESTEVNNNYQLAADLAASGNEVTLLLIENGVLAARSFVAAQGLTNLNKVTLLADKFSLDERGIDSSELASNIEVSSVTSIVNAMSQGQKMMWL